MIPCLVEGLGFDIMFRSLFILVCFLSYIASSIMLVSTTSRVIQRSAASSLPDGGFAFSATLGLLCRAVLLSGMTCNLSTLVPSGFLRTLVCLVLYDVWRFLIALVRQPLLRARVSLVGLAVGLFDGALVSFLSSTSTSEPELDSYDSTVERREVRAFRCLRDLVTRFLVAVRRLSLSARLERVNLPRVVRRLLFI